LWDLHTSDDHLLEIAADLGSDVPFALIGGTAQGVGRGELVTSLPDRGSYWWVVVPSDEGLSTPDVYREFDRLHPDIAAGAHVRDPRGLIAALKIGDADRVAASMRNDLEEAAISLRPELAERIDLVHAHRSNTVMLSGSGPTILGIAKSQEAALESRAALLEAGVPVVHVATGPVAGAHVVEYA
jgi:4-diphosphocytidyl-2-C-methyl-D-erythritol kinase